MFDNFGLHPRAAVRELVHVRTPLLNLELFEGTAPDQTTTWPRMLDIGGLHIAVYVDDPAAALTYLTDRGCTALGGTKPFTGPEAGEDAKFVHRRTSFGMYPESVSYPHGRAYENAASLASWNPTQPDDLARNACGTVIG